eukprot:2298722-Rhodomonas_salina.4
MGAGVTSSWAEPVGSACFNTARLRLCLRRQGSALHCHCPRASSPKRCGSPLRRQSRDSAAMQAPEIACKLSTVCAGRREQLASSSSSSSSSASSHIRSPPKPSLGLRVRPSPA